MPAGKFPATEIMAQCASIERSLLREEILERHQVAEFQRQALHMPQGELWRHAQVAYDNGHRCRTCFVCICADELEKRADVREKVRQEIANNPDQWD